MKNSIIIAFLFLSIGISAQSTINYEYDNLQRLTKVIYPTGSYIQYSYDANGNRNQEVKVYQNLSVEEIEASFQVAVFPNPFYEVLHIKASENNVLKATIYDQSSKIWQTISNNSLEINLDVATLPQAIYFLEIITEKGTRTIKVIKK